MQSDQTTNGVDSTPSTTTAPQTTCKSSGQNGTVFDTFPIPLTPAQQLAIQLLAQGQSDSEVARTVGVHRHTIARWKLYHPTVQARLNALRQTLWQSAVDHLRSLLTPALHIITNRLTDAADRPAQLRAAIQTLKISGISKAVHRIGPAFVRDVLQNRFLTENRPFHKIGPECNMYPPDNHDLKELQDALLSFIAAEEAKTHPADPPDLLPSAID